MKAILILAVLLLAGCSHKIIAKECKQADETYFICDSLNLTGK
jgi:hypothetical protein